MLYDPSGGIAHRGSALIWISLVGTVEDDAIIAVGSEELASALARPLPGRTKQQPCDSGSPVGGLHIQAFNVACRCSVGARQIPADG